MPENVKLSRYFHSIDYCSLFISIDTKKLGLIGIIPLRGKRWGGGGREGVPPPYSVPVTF